jgi:signal transduction histidine kinase
VVVGSVLLCGALVAALVSLAVRYRAAPPVERQQLKWVGVAGVLLAAYMPFAIAFWVWSPLVRGAASVVLAAVALALGASVLRYGLFQVDLVINRALVYAGVSLLLAGVYAATAVVLGAVLGGPSSWTVAGATLAAAFLFRPLRRSVQDVVDRRFDRKRYSARLKVAAFLDGVRAGIVPAERVEEVLRDALHDPTLDVLIHLPTSGEYTDVRGRAACVDATRRSVRIDRTGLPNVVVQYDGAEDPAREAEVRDVAEAGLLAVEIARMHVELNRQLDELERSRARIAGAADDERRRIQRDLHDGAQQRLVTVGIALRALEARMRAAERHEDAARLDSAVADLVATIEELRDLAHRLPPAQLDEGIGAAFAELAERAPFPVAVDARVPRLDRAIEATGYFVGCEALTNVIKHAQASRATLRAGLCPRRRCRGRGAAPRIGPGRAGRPRRGRRR